MTSHASNQLPSTFSVLLAAVLLLLGGASHGYAQEIAMSPTRPTISNSATIQSKGVLQVEVGYDAYPQRVPGNQQTVATLFTYAPLDRLRLDFGWSPFTHQQMDADVVNGVSTIQIGGKVELRKEQYHRPQPGIAVQYEAELPTASNQALQGYGQQFILLLNHHYGPEGNLDLIVNGSLVQSDCQTDTGCRYGGQHAVAVSYHLQKETRLYAELFAQNNSQSNTPPGTYFFSGFYRQVNDSFGFDGGVRFGLSDHSASIGTTVGVVFGKRLHGETAPQQLEHP
jgi:hypothetical protein